MVNGVQQVWVTRVAESFVWCYTVIADVTLSHVPTETFLAEVHARLQQLSARQNPQVILRD